MFHYFHIFSASIVSSYLVTFLILFPCLGTNSTMLVICITVYCHFRCQPLFFRNAIYALSDPLAFLCGSRVIHVRWCNTYLSLNPLVPDLNLPADGSDKYFLIGNDHKPPVTMDDLLTKNSERDNIVLKVLTSGDYDVPNFDRSVISIPVLLHSCQIPIYFKSAVYIISYI